jgi:hypothetical protein
MKGEGKEEAGKNRRIDNESTSKCSASARALGVETLKKCVFVFKEK